MNCNVKYVISLIIILVFTCLAMGLHINSCGNIYSNDCQRDWSYMQMSALIATSLVLFVIGGILAIVSMYKSKRWIFIAEFIAVCSGGIFLLASLCIFYRDNYYWAPLMAGIGMTVALETAIFMLIDMLTKKEDTVR
ncbi:hypothetical protein Aperf_G00000013132 [Anoplocephala perfoliata]